MANSPFFPSTISLVGQTANPVTTQNSDTTQAPVSLGRAGDLLVSRVRGDYGTMAHRGNVFWGCITTAALTIPINTTTTASTFALLNPAGSGVYAEPIDFDLNQLAAGPATQNIMGFSLNNMAVNPQSATALVPIPGPIRAGGNPSNFNGGTPGCTLLGGATCIQFTGALSVAANWGIAMFSFPASYFPTAATNFGPWHYAFNGKVILPPGWCMTLTASTAWGANTAIPAMSWAEYKI